MLRDQSAATWSLLPRELGNNVYLGVISALKNEIVDPDALAAGDREHLERLLSLFESSRLLEPWLAPWRGTAQWEPATRQIPNALVFIYRAYCALMRNHGRIDFDDQKLLAYTALAKDAATAAQLLSSIKTVIVDEFQDINRLDFELVRLLAKDRELVIVGDDDQAIYAFRGCTPRYIIDFEKESGRPTTSVVLHVNYRCPKNVVAMANKLIANNTNRVEKRQVAHRSDDADVQLWHAINAGGEAQVIARTIRKLYEERREKGLQYSDMAVLFRMNSQSLPLQIALILEEVPYHCRKEDNVILSGAMSELVELLGLHLELLRDRSYFSESAARLVCRTYFRYLKDWQVDRFVEAARRGGLLRAVEVLGGQQGAPRELVDPAFQKGLMALAQAGTPPRVVGVVAEHFKHVAGMVGTLEDAINNQAPLGEFAEIAARFRGSVSEFHALLTSLQERVRNGLFHAEVGGDAVNLLTYFRAKGLQWNTVFIPGVNQKVIPHSKANVEDERRLFYVAVTRASSNLVLSYVRTVVGQSVEPSQFLSEMGLVSATERRATFIK